MYTGSDYWKNYIERWFGKEVIEKWEKHVVIENASHFPTDKNTMINGRRKLIVL
ncbi:hypothetical protein SAMN05446037_100749 [Anaerovirgula multivorans]|uniref:Uncharacterized protein n=1 Tax=Anaerovirgula multivorans TaxID=312168 RepID=A0A239D943_9FIRM|nr:hypothetical protein [Anaerovirgula multivorans]SNS28558.1 hypothetical protein SAMN05446037_100749 [Anaerovirgula multivorans]